MWCLFGLLVCLPGILTFTDWQRGRSERCGFLGVWASMLVTLNARAYCWAVWGSTDKPGWEQYHFAWPTVAPCWYFAYGWALAVLLQHFYVPREWPRSGKHALRYFCLAFGLLLVCLFCLYHTPAEGCNPAEHLGFLRDQSQTTLPILSLLLTELLFFLERGEGNGVRAILLLPPVLWALPMQLYGSDWIVVGLREPALQPAVVVFVLLAAWSVLLRAATPTEPTRIRSTSPMYKVVDLETLSGCSGAWKRFTLWLSTWRGANIVYLANGWFTLLGYWSSREALVVNIRGTLRDEYADGQGKWYKGVHIIDTLCFLAVCSIAVSSFNLFEDTVLVGANKKCSRLWNWLPFDRHFRLLTVLKVALLWLKMELLVFTCWGCKDSMSSGFMVFQITSIVLTSLITCYSSLALLAIAKRIHGFGDLYRMPKLMWSSVTVGVVTLTTVNAAMMICKFLGPENMLIRVLHEKGCVGVLLNLGQTYYVPFFCLSNEAALSISSKASNPKVFAGLTSSRGVWALCVYCAAKFPVEIVVNCVECQFLLPSYMSSLFLFSESWVEPMYGYATLLLICSGVAAYVACGGDGLEWAPAETGGDGDAGSSSDDCAVDAPLQPGLQPGADRVPTIASTLSGLLPV